MSSDIQVFVIDQGIPTISRTGRCSNHFDFLMRLQSRLITNAQLFEKHYESWDYNWRSLSASPAQVCEPKKKTAPLTSAPEWATPAALFCGLLRTGVPDKLNGTSFVSA
jgi:hypothetical protein